MKTKTGAPGGIRTPDHQLRRQVLYPTELRALSGNDTVKAPRCCDKANQTHLCLFGRRMEGN